MRQCWLLLVYAHLLLQVELSCSKVRNRCRLARYCGARLLFERRQMTRNGFTRVVADLIVVTQCVLVALRRHLRAWEWYLLAEVACRVGEQVILRNVSTINLESVASRACCGHDRRLALVLLHSHKWTLGTLAHVKTNSTWSSCRWLCLQIFSLRVCLL